MFPPAMKKGLGYLVISLCQEGPGVLFLAEAGTGSPLSTRRHLEFHSLLELAPCSLPLPGGAWDHVLRWSGRWVPFLHQEKSGVPLSTGENAGCLPSSGRCLGSRYRWIKRRSPSLCQEGFGV